MKNISCLVLLLICFVLMGMNPVETIQSEPVANYSLNHSLNILPISQNGVYIYMWAYDSNNNNVSFYSNIVWIPITSPNGQNLLRDTVFQNKISDKESQFRSFIKDRYNVQFLSGHTIFGYISQNINQTLMDKYGPSYNHEKLTKNQISIGELMDARSADIQRDRKNGKTVHQINL